MQIEYEATFANVDKDDVRNKLKAVGAELVKPEFMQRRRNFNLPKGNEIEGGWIRIRDEKDKITMTLKVINGDRIHDQKEINLKIDNFNAAEEFLISLGCTIKSYQETKRELWSLDNVEICIDEWPYLEPFVEVEGLSEEDVKKVSEKIGFNYGEALFCGVATLYSKKYNIDYNIVDKEIPKITFEMPNPFLKFVKNEN